jgi:hypothetical protein
MYINPIVPNNDPKMGIEFSETQFMLERGLLSNIHAYKRHLNIR